MKAKKLVWTEDPVSNNIIATVGKGISYTIGGSNDKWFVVPDISGYEPFQTLEEAQEGAQEHFNQYVESLLEDKRIWSTGEVPKPTGPAVLYRKEAPHSPFIALPAFGHDSRQPEDIRWIWDNGRGCQYIKYVEMHEHWFIQAITLPDTSGTGEQAQ